MNKRFFSLFLCFVMVLSLMPNVVLAANTGVSSNSDFQVTVGIDRANFTVKANWTPCEGVYYYEVVLLHKRAGEFVPDGQSCELYPEQERTVVFDRLRFTDPSFLGEDEWQVKVISYDYYSHVIAAAYSETFSMNVPQLDKPKVKLNMDGILTVNPVPDANRYTIELYESRIDKPDSLRIKTTVILDKPGNCDLSSHMEKGYAYHCYVRAWDSNHWSIRSEETISNWIDYRDVQVPNHIQWIGTEGSYAVKWTDFDSRLWTYNPKDRTKVQLRLYKLDAGHNRSLMCIKEVPVTNGTLEAGTLDFTADVVKGGDGEYYVQVWALPNGSEHNSNVATTHGRDYASSDYFYFTSQSPADGETVMATKDDKLYVSYSVADIPQWLKDAGVTLVSNNAYLYINGDPVDERNSTMVMPNTGKLSWKNDTTLHYVGTHTLHCAVAIRVNDWSTGHYIESDSYVQVSAPKPSSAADFTFVRRPINQVLKNGEKPTISWETNMTVPTVFVEVSDDNGEKWMNFAKIASNVTSGSYTINQSRSHTRCLYRLCLRDSEGKYAYSDPFYVTWTNDGKNPIRVFLPDETIANGQWYHITVPFNYGSTGYSDNSFKTRFMIFETDAEGSRIANVGSNARMVSVNGGSGLEVAVWGYENCTKYFSLCIYNSSKMSDNNSLGIPTQTVNFSVTWADIAVTYDVTFEPNGGEGRTLPFYVYARESGMASCILPPCTYTPPEGMIFDHWEYRYEDVYAYLPGYTAVPGEEVWFNRGIVVRPVWRYLPVDCGGDPTWCPLSVFQDAPKYTNWAHAGIEYCVRNGLMGGTSASTFEPKTPMTRAMLVTVIYRMEGEPGTGNSTFSDVKPGRWYYDPISWAADEGIVAGVGDGKFNPNGNVTREQIAAILYRYAGYKGYNTKPAVYIAGFADYGKVSKYAIDPLKWAVALDLVKGTTSGGKLYLDPKGAATREQVAAILMRFCEGVAK